MCTSLSRIFFGKFIKSSFLSHLYLTPTSPYLTPSPLHFHQPPLPHLHQHLPSPLHSFLTTSPPTPFHPKKIVHSKSNHHVFLPNLPSPPHPSPPPHPPPPRLLHRPTLPPPLPHLHFPLRRTRRPLPLPKSHHRRTHFPQPTPPPPPPRPSNKIRSSSSIKSPKIAFLFLTNSDLTFSPIWNLFFNQTNTHLFNIYIHSDPSIKIKYLEGFFKNRIIPSKKTQRSSPTLISAARRLLATAILDDPRNTYFALISQHCIPLHSFGYFYNTLFDADAINQGLPSYIEVLDNETTLWDRYNARGKNVMEPEVGFSEFRVGSQFFVISRRHALRVIEDRKLWRKFKLPCLNVESCYPEEHYFPTLLSMVDPRGCSNFTFTRVNWTDSVDGHPHTYFGADVSVDLIYTLRESNLSVSYMFARKFAPDCLKPLMEIAESVIFKD